MLPTIATIPILLKLMAPPIRVSPNKDTLTIIENVNWRNKMGKAIIHISPIGISVIGNVIQIKHVATALFQGHTMKS